MKTWLSVMLFSVSAAVGFAVEENNLYDTGSALPQSGTTPFTVEAGKWIKVAGGAGAIKGDAVLCNRWTAAVVRGDGSGVDLYAQTASGWAHRARLVPLAGDGATKFSGTTAIPKDGAAAVTIKPQGNGQGTIELCLSSESPLLKATAKGKVDGLRISAPCRWGVLPDFFTDDLLVDARQITTPQTEIPIDRLYLQMLDNGNSILAIVCDKNESDLRVSLSGEGEQRVMKDTDVSFGKDGSVWLGTMEYKGIWHSHNLTREENQKGVTLHWDVPFDASWKGDITLTNGDVHSEAINNQIKWAKNEPKNGTVSIAKGDTTRIWEGPLLAYPLRRNDQTPLQALLLDDFMRLSLGSGPCAFILDVDGRINKNHGLFTCSYAATVPRMLSKKREDISFAKEERVMLRHVDKAVVTFMEHIESRIGLYAGFRKETLGMLDQKEQKNPDLADFIGKLKAITASLPEKAPAGSKLIAANLRVVEKAILLDTPAQMAASIEMANTPPHVAEPQDDQVAECRRTMKLLRSRAVAEFVKNPALAKNPVAVEIVRDIREKSQIVMHGPASHEGGESW